MSIFLVLLIFAVGVVIGAFSHKWLASEFTKATGQDAQAVADKLKGKKP